MEGILKNNGGCENSVLNNRKILPSLRSLKSYVLMDSVQTCSRLVLPLPSANCMNLVENFFRENVSS